MNLPHWREKVGPTGSVVVAGAGVPVVEVSVVTVAAAAGAFHLGLSVSESARPPPLRPQQQPRAVADPPAPTGPKPTRPSQVEWAWARRPTGPPVPWMQTGQRIQKTRRQAKWPCQQSCRRWVTTHPDSHGQEQTARYQKKKTISSDGDRPNDTAHLKKLNAKEGEE